jgi:SpoIID/LytB domain protein
MGSRRTGSLVARAAGVAALALAGLTVAASGAPAAADTVRQVIRIPAGDTHLVVTYRGNGHGHGLSQFGALGAAKQGQSYRSILSFYYPKTALKQAPRSAHIRVRLSGTGKTTTVAARPHLVVKGVDGALPTRAIARYRLVADSGSQLALQKLASTTGARWRNVATGLPNGAAFRRTNGDAVRLYLTDGTSTGYFGALRAVRRSVRGVYTVNRVSYDNYTKGVVPREMPASWPAQAVDAQAVAARTYGDYAVHYPMKSSYDICDSTWCQVYGGHVHYNRDGSVAWNDDPNAATDTSRQVLSYNGHAVFAQFSASNGGWTVPGGQPYLVARQDNHDIARFDPYINQKTTVSTKSLASEFGLTKLTKLVLVRDGNGTWNGRVLEVSAFNGTKRVDEDGFFLQGAFGLGTTWLQIKPTA